MSNVVIQDWKYWDSYEDIISAVDNLKDDVLGNPALIDTIDETDCLDAKNEEDLVSNHSPFFAISGTTAYDKDGSLEFESIEEETKACMNAVEGTQNIKMIM